MSDRILPLAAVDRLIRKGGGYRVSEDASVELANLLEDHAIKISRVATELAKHANRKTVTGEDVKLAAKNNQGGQ